MRRSTVHLALSLLPLALVSCGEPIPDCSGIALVEEELCVPVELPPSETAEAPTRRSIGRAILTLEPQVDLDALSQLLQRRDARTRGEHRRLVVAALERASELAARELEPLLDELRREGGLDLEQRFAIGNRLYVEGEPEAVSRLAAHPAVRSLEERTPQPLPAWQSMKPGETVGEPGSVRPSDTARQRPGEPVGPLEKIGALELQRQGLDGRGVVVGILDSGASSRHVHLAPGYRGGAESWHDPALDRPEPADAALGHGTSVLSIAVGRPVGETAIGVAPGAAWVACAGLPEGKYDNLLVTACADWLLRVAQPDVLVNAWLIPEPGCDRSLARVIDAWRAAEIVTVFAAGNFGPGEASGHSPANYAGLFPGTARTLSVGALDRADRPLPSSARGPSACDGGIYPALSAPGHEIQAAFALTPNAYRRMDGTSAAAGLVAGAAAILRQRHPEATAGEIEAALRAGAIDVGPPGLDNATGAGRLDLASSLTWLDAARGDRGGG